MDRRQFVTLASTVGTGLLGGTAKWLNAAEDAPLPAPLDPAAANRKLAEHRIKHVETRPFHDRFPRSVGPNSKGRPVGGGGGGRVCLVTTDRGVTGWCMRTHQTAQLAAGVGNVPIVEGIPGRTPGIDYSAYRMHDGKLVMPDEPGFGFRLES